MAVVTIAPVALFVQRVTTRWTQESRGGAAATRRNQQPQGFAFPEQAQWHSVELVTLREERVAQLLAFVYRVAGRRAG